MYYAAMLRCWHLVWILVRTDHPCLGVGCHSEEETSENEHVKKNTAEELIQLVDFEEER
jgi:hypothetical protein